jgi:tetratricopeptide (TPR) repeat protein
MAGLVDQSLVRRADGGDGGRFLMLETIREYALEQLAAFGEADAVRRRHAEYFLQVAEAAQPELHQSTEALERVAEDHDNFRAVLAWAVENAEADLGLRLAYSLWRFWHQRAHLREGREWFEKLLSLPASGARGEARFKGLTGAGGIAYWQNDYPAAEAWYQESESIARGLGDRRALAEALFNTTSMAALRGDIPGARAKVREIMGIARDLGDDQMLAQALAYDGYAAFMTDDFDNARTTLEEALALTVPSGDKLAIAQGHHMVAQVARLQGRLADAADHYRQAVAAMHELGDAASLTEPLQGLAAIAVATGDPERGVRLLGANAAIRERIGGGPPPEWLRLGDPLGDAKNELSEVVYDAAWNAGQEMSVDEAVSDALHVRPMTEPGTPVEVG